MRTKPEFKYEQYVKALEKNEELRIERDYYYRLFHRLLEAKIVAFDKKDL